MEIELLLVIRLLLTFIAGVLVLFMLAFVWNHPPLFDRPGFGSRIKTYLTTNIAETSSEPVFPELQMPVYSLPAHELLQVVQRAVTKLGWETVEIDTQTRKMRAVVTTPVWRFKDDVVVRVDEIQPSMAALYLHSQSRTGKGDFGANTRHILNLIDTVNAILIEEPGARPGS